MKEVQFEIANNNCGVYVLMEKGVVVYVGRSASVLTRLSSHYKRPFDSVRVLWCEKSEIRELESKMIQELNPVRNKRTQKIFCHAKSGSINWAKMRDVDVALIMGVTRERARQVRKMFSLPKCENHGLSAGFIAFEKAVEGLAAIKYEDFERFGGRATIKSWGEHLGVSVEFKDARKGFDWSRVNWDFGNGVLADAIGYHTTMLSRMRKAYGWKRKIYPGHPLSEESLAILADHKKMAEEFRKNEQSFFVV